MRECSVCVPLGPFDLKVLLALSGVAEMNGLRKHFRNGSPWSSSRQPRTVRAITTHDLPF